MHTRKPSRRSPHITASKPPRNEVRLRVADGWLTLSAPITRKPLVTTQITNGKGEVTAQLQSPWLSNLLNSFGTRCRFVGTESRAGNGAVGIELWMQAQ